ncbi:hypothetical protein LSG31_00680 [Fodinisporobacter ferrooxydans]|uniref:Tetrapyrrole biosynthesis glutamyl-tRNA reductase dimerisation domain-containing protein n=1 Tax=Fodinisporobacter ferrooxydans TaxID=2901836 RepID=A0ABY4CK99_9BACL|nr:hypothetical protein LSG31_00680 [Alicyclobacillaceae bacterium MYW30-H2]
MTQQELAELKAQIKSELLQEMEQERQTRSAWDRVRHAMQERLADLDPGKRHKIISGMSPLIRYALGLKRAVNMTDDLAPHAIDIANQILDLIVAESQEHSKTA